MSHAHKPRGERRARPLINLDWASKKLQRLCKSSLATEAEAATNKVDALWSAGNYLSAFGYKADLPYAERRKVIWEYNRSEAYIDTVFRVASRIRSIGEMGCRRQRGADHAEAIKVGWCPEPRE